MKKRFDMTTSYFDQLTEMAQTDVIWEAGVYLDRRTEGFNTILLFQLDNFYTEIYYHSHFNVILRVVSFTDTNQLAPYLEKINLGPLLKN